MLINLWVKEKRSGRIHQVGTEIHDAVIFLDGQVIYENLQSTASTLDDYEWVDPPDIDDYISVTPEQLYLNREMVHKDLLEKLKRSDTE